VAFHREPDNAEFLEAIARAIMAKAARTPCDRTGARLLAINISAVDLANVQSRHLACGRTVGLKIAAARSQIRARLAAA
jgi:hypothetical protein